MIWTAHRRTWLPLLVATLAGCVAPGPSTPIDPADKLEPTERDTSYRDLRVTVDGAPAAGDFGSFCNSMPRSVALPQVYQETDAELTCPTWGCFRDALEDTEVTAMRGSAVVSGSRWSKAIWRPEVTEEGIYSVQVWLPGFIKDFSKEVRYTIYHGTGDDEVVVGHARQIDPDTGVELAPSDRGRWVGLGIYRFGPDTEARIEITAPGSGKFVVDALRLYQMPSPNLTNAAWLAWLSANEYSHFANMGPALEQLGFGAEGEGTRWQECAEDMWAAEEWDEAAYSPLSQRWVPENHGCLDDWIQSTFIDAGADAPASMSALAARFQQHLIQSTSPEGTIEFFSGGRFTFDGEAFEAGSTQAVFAQHRTRPMAIIAFRGTELREDQKWADLAADAKFWKLILDEAPFGPEWGSVHSGFLEAYQAIEPQLLEKVRSLPRNTRIYVTGHSLGAALATLMSARIMAEVNQGADLWLAGLYTYGSPRVGDRDFRATFHQRSAQQGAALLRVRNNADGISRIPFSVRIPLTKIYLMDYAHVGGQLYIDSFGNLELAPARLSNEFASAMADHNIVTYYERILAGANDPELAAFNQCPEEWFETLDELEQ